MTPDPVLAQAGSENFPVASRVLGGRQRRHLMALYGIARLIDDTGDEAEGDRLARLDALEGDLRRAWGGRPEHPLILGLQPTVVACELPFEPFGALIEANRQDQRVTRYSSYEELLGYCRLSANPVGELVLRVFGAATPERIGLSNRICTALQLAEHLQDVAEDAARGRVYLPREDLRRFAVGEDVLLGGEATNGFRALMRFEVARARAVLDAGAPLVATLRGRIRFAVAAFVAGGRTALQAIAQGHYDVLGARPRPGLWLRSAGLAGVLSSGGRR